MAKKIRTVLTLQLPAGTATPAPPVGTALGPHGINIVEFTKSYNEKTAGQARPGHPGPDHDLRGSLLHVHPQDPARGGPAAQGGRCREGRGDHRPRDGRPGHRATRSARSPTIKMADLNANDIEARRDRSKAPPARWASRSSASIARPARRGSHPGPRPREPRGRPEPPADKEERHMAERGKKYQDAAKLVDRDAALRAGRGGRAAQADDAPSTSTPSVEAHIRLGVDPRHADQMVRGTVVLPHGTGKTVRVAVFAQGEKAQEALAAGADEVGGEDLVKRIEAGWLEFDVALATPDMMGMVGRLGQILGRRGLMPNPKSGHDHLRPRARDQARSRAAASSSRSTRPASSTSPSARASFEAAAARREPGRAGRRGQPRQADAAPRASTSRA